VLAGRVDDDYQLPGIELETYSYPAIPGLSRALNGHLNSRALMPRLRRYKPDLVLAYWIYPDGYAALRAARSLAVPCVIGALGSDIHVRSGLNRWMTRHTIAGADALLTVSEAMRQTAIRKFGAAPSRVHAIVNGFDTAIFRPRPRAAMRERLGIATDARVIIYVGRFVQAKGLLELLEAFRTLAARDPRATLALVGDGVMREELIERIRASGLGERILIPGGLIPEQVAEWICAADVLTLPSWSEGYPNVVVEAVACGCPVVATDVGGTCEIIHADNGILIPPRDPTALGNALQTALDSTWDHARIAASIQRTWDDVAKETFEVCEQILAMRAPR
jgi:glycosyltransferase involved in cell wall biosynthesis